MPEILVLRHSEATANAQGVLMGAKLDSPLSKHGREVAQNKGKSLRIKSFFPDRVYSSKLKRAQQTAKIIGNELGIETDIIELATLNERDFGKYDGKPYKFVIEAFNKHGTNPPTVEKADVFITRAMNEFENIKKVTTSSTLVVTHSNVVSVLFCLLFKPELLHEFWKIPDVAHCEGFLYKF